LECGGLAPLWITTAEFQLPLVQEVANFNLPRVHTAGATQNRQQIFVVALIACVAVSALFATLLPLQVSIVTVFLFAGPHNWFELRYFLQRLPVRFGKSRNFFITAFVGLGLLTAAYVSMPFIFASGSWSEQSWLSILATWNSIMLLWVATLIWLRGRQKHRNWSLSFAVAFAVSAANWLAPELFSLAIVYLHPLVALWFLDRHLVRNRPSWVKSYRRSLVLIPVALSLIIWRLSQAPSLADNNGLFWRITQHSGADLLPAISSHLLVTVHLFLEILHYAVWLLALPLIGRAGAKAFSTLQASKQTESQGLSLIATIPVARHTRGFPKLIGSFLLLGIAAVVMLWVGFSIDYSTTRDIYFTVAIAHVLAEAPFLLKMI